MTRREGVHRARARRTVHGGRVGALAAAVLATLVIGSVSIVTQLRTDPAAAETLVADASDPAIVSAFLPAVEAPADAAEDTAPPDVPARSGDGRRVVFSQGQQRVWLVEQDGSVARTYLVSGSRHDNLEPGSYAVNARYRNATAFDYSGTMQFFVQFTSGDNAPIGFHDVPRDNDGDLEQTREELGTALSAGCVRQWHEDAVALWKFADQGTPVVVTAV